MYEAGLTACYTSSVPWGIYRGIKTMGKLPAFWFYPGDWIQDTRCLSLAAKGAWIDILCAMWRSPTRGSLSLPIIGWVRLISASVDQTEAIISELVDMQICNTVTDHNKNITLTNRRMVREEKERQQNVDRQKKFREKQQGKTLQKEPSNGKSNADVISLLQSSSSSSVLNTNKPLMQNAGKNIPHSAGWPEEDLWLCEFLKSRDLFTRHGYVSDGLLDYTYWDNVSQIVHGLSKEFLEPEFARISTWFDDNPGRKPTQRGLRRFIKGWIERAHNKERRFKT